MEGLKKIYKEQLLLYARIFIKTEEEGHLPELTPEGKEYYKQLKKYYYYGRYLLYPDTKGDKDT